MHLRDVVCKLLLVVKENKQFTAETSFKLVNLIPSVSWNGVVNWIDLISQEAELLVTR